MNLVGRLDLCPVKIGIKALHNQKRIPHNSEKGSNPLTVKKGTEDRTEGKKRGKEDKL